MQLSNLLKFNENNGRRLSIDFGASFIKLAWIESNGDKYRLLAYALGELSSSQKTVEEISFFLKRLLETNSITEKEVAISISDPDWIFIKKLTLPQMPNEELFNAVKWQLKGQLPFNADESVSDLQIIREFTDSEGARKVELFCVFARKDIVNKYVSVATLCGLSPVKISSSVFNYCATLNSLSSNPEITAILDIGHTHSQVAIYQKDKLIFARSLNFSTEKLSASLVGTLAVENGKLEINIDKADEILRDFGVLFDEGQVLEGGIKANQIISLIRPSLEIIVKELSRSFEYFKSESGLDIPGVLYITGGGANLRNLDNYLKDALKMNVGKLPLPDLLSTKSVDKAKLFLDSNQLSSAIGLSLSNSGINLLPREIKNRKIERIQKTSLRVSATSIAAIFLFSLFVINFQINDYRKRLKIAQAHLQSLEEIKNLKQMVDSRESFINKIHYKKTPSGGLLKLMGAIIPSNILLDEFDFNESTHSMLIRGSVLAGKESVEKVLTDFMNKLEDSDFVVDANLLNSRDDAGVNNFEIECVLNK